MRLAAWHGCRERFATPAFHLPWPAYLWFAAILSGFALLDGVGRPLTAYLVPPFAATLSIILLLPHQPVARPAAVVLGSTLGAGLGTLAGMLGHGPLLAALTAAGVFMLLSRLGLYHPPALALSMYPLLLHPGPWFALASVLPFTLVAVGTATLLSRRVAAWPPYPLGNLLQGEEAAG
ncbi:MAG: HPP family protein [Firmicutes bacterium]|nr:HPP family protein [Bacillota bacterium]